MWRDRLKKGPLDPGSSGAFEQDLPHRVRVQTVWPDGIPLRHAAEHRSFPDLGNPQPGPERPDRASFGQSPTHDAELGSLSGRIGL